MADPLKESEEPGRSPTPAAATAAEARVEKASAYRMRAGVVIMIGGALGVVGVALASIWSLFCGLQSAINLLVTNTINNIAYLPWVLGFRAVSLSGGLVASIYLLSMGAKLLIPIDRIPAESSHGGEAGKVAGAIEALAKLLK